jgi:hypothetical protein
MSLSDLNSGLELVGHNCRVVLGNILVHGGRW